VTVRAQETSGYEAFDAITRKIADIPIRFPMRGWWLAALGIALALLLWWFVALAVLFSRGVGVWGLNIPVGWGLAISNYVWWLGIGHAGTLISAMLLVFHQDWRNALNRFAEAMTLFAVICAAAYPIIHLGRPWLFYWVLPYPATTGVWPQFLSPLVWDAFAVSCYLIVSIIFWYVGLIPDLAAARDKARRRHWQVFFGILALGWCGSARHWARWRQAYAALAILAVPLVVSVHSEVSLLFAAGPVPGWHTTVFPPYFVAGAAFSGFAVVSILAISLRAAFRLQDLVTTRHLEMLALLLLATGLMTGYGYVSDAFMAWYSGDPFEFGTLRDRWFGEYDWSYWSAVVCNLVSIQLLWWRRARRSPLALFAVSVVVVIGMWEERYMLLVTGLYHDYLPSSWGPFNASFWEWSVYVGSFGLFFTPFLLFIRLLPMNSISDLKETAAERGGERHASR
jgi:molybdopterin-containing oxidoreductase family membrane subunit